MRRDVGQELVDRDRDFDAAMPIADLSRQAPFVDPDQYAGAETDHCDKTLTISPWVTAKTIGQASISVKTTTASEQATANSLFQRQPR